jgi:FMN phosphatase YigB (HAD superfamily)
MKTILVDAINCFVIEGQGVFNEMYKLLEQYPNRKIILTGANYERMKTLGLHNMPYAVFTLEHDPEKTNPEYFISLLRHFNLQKDDVIYFEHNDEAVKSAQSVGINTYHYNHEKQDLSALRDFLDKNL